MRALRGADGSIAHFVSGTTNEIIRHGEILTGEVAATFIASAQEIHGANLIYNDMGILYLLISSFL